MCVERERERGERERGKEREREMFACRLDDVYEKE